MLYVIYVICYSEFYEYIQSSGITLLLLYDPLRPDPTKWSNTPKQSLFDDFVGSASRRVIF